MGRNFELTTLVLVMLLAAVGWWGGWAAILAVLIPVTVGVVPFERHQLLNIFFEDEES